MKRLAIYSIFHFIFVGTLVVVLYQNKILFNSEHVAVSLLFVIWVITSTFLPIYTSITAKKMAEQNRHLLNLEEVINGSCIVSEADKNGKIIRANSRFCNISGYKLEELLGEDHRIVNSGKHSNRYFKDMWDTIGQGKSWRGILCNKKKKW